MQLPYEEFLANRRSLEEVWESVYAVVGQS